MSDRSGWVLSQKKWIHSQELRLGVSAKKIRTKRSSAPSGFIVRKKESIRRLSSTRQRSLQRISQKD